MELKANRPRKVARILQDAGKHALNDQTNPRDMRKLEASEDCFHFTSNTDERLQQFISKPSDLCQRVRRLLAAEAGAVLSRPTILVCGLASTA